MEFVIEFGRNINKGQNTIFVDDLAKLFIIDIVSRLYKHYIWEHLIVLSPNSS